MKIKIVGRNDCAKALRQRLLESTTVSLIDEFIEEKADYTVTIRKSIGTETIIDSIDAPLERSIVKNLRKSGIPHLVLMCKGIVQRENEIDIIYPHTHEDNISKGIYQGLEMLRREMVGG